MEIGKDNIGYPFRELEDSKKDKFYAKIIFEDNIQREIELKNGSINEILELQKDTEKVLRFQIYNKKRVIIDDIEMHLPYNTQPWVYFGERIPALQYYHDQNLLYPIGEFDTYLNRKITAADLMMQTYIKYTANGVVDKNVLSDSMTITELKQMLENNPDKDLHISL